MFKSGGKDDNITKSKGQSSKCSRLYDKNTLYYKIGSQGIWGSKVKFVSSNSKLFTLYR